MIERIKYKMFLASLLFALSILAGGNLAVSAQQPYRATDQQVNTVLRRIESHTDIFRDSLNNALNANRISGSTQADDIGYALRSFEEATAHLSERFRTQRSVATDVETLLNRASRLDSMLNGMRLTGRVNSDWRALRTDLDQLARFYNLNRRWNDQASYPSRVSGTLNGTWRLDTSRSDNIEDAADRAARGSSIDQRSRVRDQIIRRLESPETIGIEQRGRRVTIASTRAPQVSFEADGRNRTETTNRGRTVRVNASLYGDQLTIATTGDRGSDYHVTFDPIDGGQRMRVTRRIYNERLSQPVIVNSLYEKISDVAQLNLYSGRLEPAVANRPTRGRFIVPNNTQLIAVLNTNLSTKDVRPGDRFSLTVRSPRQYDGAVIEGVITDIERSGRVSGRAGMSLDFERINLPGGGTYEFEGYVENIRTPRGENIRVDNEGSVKEDDSQTERTVTRAGIGAAIGAVIGAIAGGGKGAAIGAAIGAGAGAGSIFIQGRDDLDLQSGTELTIRASSPSLREASR